MSFEMLHFRGSEAILKDKAMATDVRKTLEYLDSVLYGSIHRRELLRVALDEMGWRHERVLSVLDGRRYYYKGIKQRVAMEGSLAVYEYILEGLLRLQIGFQKERIDMGVLLLPAQRGDKTPYGSTRKLVEEEIEDLYPTIDLPVSIVLFDLGRPGETMEEEVSAQGQTKDTAKERKAPVKITKPEVQNRSENPSDISSPETKSRPGRKRRLKPLSAN